MVGLGDRLGKVRQGYVADLPVVNGNPVARARAERGRGPTATR